MKKNVAVVGTGYWGKNLVRVFRESGALHTVCDSEESALAALKLPGEAEIKTTLSYAKVLSDPEIAAVVIATPAATHFKAAREALLNSKDVFVEKPLALTLSEGEELVGLAQEKGRVLMVGHILNYHPAVLKLKELIDAGALGQIRYLYSNRLNFGKIRQEENILWSFAPHDISVILMLLGEEPIKVTATGATYLQPGIPDLTLSNLFFRNGVQAHIFVSWLQPYKEQKLVVIGSEKMAVFDDTSSEKLCLYHHKVLWKGRVPTAQKAEAEIVPLETGEPLTAEARHFLECIEKRAKPKTDGQEGVRVLKVLTACQEALVASSSSSLNGREGEGVKKAYFVHPSAYVDDGVEIGAGTKIWHFCHIIEGSRIGQNCKIGQNVVIGPKVTIGDNVKIQNNVSVYPGVTLEDDVFCGPSMVFTNVINPRSAIIRMHELRPTLVKKGVSIGANATIVCGHTIGRFAFIGAGTVVTKDVPDYALITGVPGRISGWMCACGVKLDLPAPSKDNAVALKPFSQAETGKGKGKIAACASCGEKYCAG